MSILSTLPTIDLATLTREGALLRRFDTKFVLGEEVLARVVGEASNGLLVLRHRGVCETEYETVYHDDDGRRSFRDHAQGRRRRFKVRTRRYGRIGPTMLEVKVKLPHGQTDKVRWDIGDVDPASPLGEPLQRRVHDAIVERYGFGLDAPIVPVVRVEFTRTTLFLPTARERLTVDSGLRFESVDGTRALGCAAATLVAEVKSPARRSELVGRLSRRGIRPTSVSKYGIALAGLEARPCPARWRVAARALAPESAIRA